MIVRTWKARTTAELEPGYLEQVRSTVLPHFKTLSGYRGSKFGRRQIEGGVEILVLTFWESLEAIAELAGEHVAHSYIPPEIAATLVACDDSSEHYEVAIEDG